MAILLILSLSIYACGPSADEVRQKEKQEREATLKKQQEEIMVYEALELIKHQSQAIARGEILPSATEAVVEEPAARHEITPAVISVANNTAGTYTIQVASLNTREKASSELNTWKQRGFNHAFISESGQNFRVRLGRYGTEGNARLLASRVNADYNVAAWVDRIRDTSSVSSPSNKNYTVQVSAVDSRSAANQEINKWNARGFSDAHYEVAQVRGYTFYRVRVGRYETQAEANQVIAQVNEQYNQDAVVFEL